MNALLYALWRPLMHFVGDTKIKCHYSKMHNESGANANKPRSITTAPLFVQVIIHASGPVKSGMLLHMNVDILFTSSWQGTACSEAWLGKAWPKKKSFCSIAVWYFEILSVFKPQSQVFILHFLVWFLFAHRRYENRIDFLLLPRGEVIFHSASGISAWVCSHAITLPLTWFP